MLRLRGINKVTKGFAFPDNTTPTTILVMMRRDIVNDSYHNYLNDVPIKQTMNVDPIHRVKSDQQQWNDTSQWVGYSDTYLSRTMRYMPTVEAGNLPFGFVTPVLDKIFGLVYDKYGQAADILEELERDPLAADFHRRVAEVRAFAAEFEDGIDELYATLHPTHKTVTDAFLARRHYALQDWITLVVKKRKQVLDKLSPAYLAQVSRMRGIAQAHVQSLERVGRAFEADPAAQLSSTSGLTEEELEIVTQRVKFHKNFKKFGSSASWGDYNPL